MSNFTNRSSVGGVLFAILLACAWPGPLLSADPFPNLPKLTVKEMADIEAKLTPEQKKLFDEYVELLAAISLKKAGDGQPVRAAWSEREVTIRVSVQMLPKDPARVIVGFCTPREVHKLRKELDPFYVSPEERAASKTVPAEIVAQVDKLVSDDTDEYLAARRKVVAHGNACLAIVIDHAKKLDPEKDGRRAFRLRLLIAELDIQKHAEQRVRVCEAGLKRVEEINKNRDPKSSSKIAVLVSTEVTQRISGDYPAENSYAGMSYLSFVTGAHGYGRAHSSLKLDLGWEADEMSVRGTVDMRNSLKDMGEVDFAKIKSAPNAAATATWNQDAQAKVGHVYIEHCLDQRHNVDMTVKFRILELRPREWIVIEWEPIPQDD